MAFKRSHDKTFDHVESVKKRKLNMQKALSNVSKTQTEWSERRRGLEDALLNQLRKNVRLSYRVWKKASRKLCESVQKERSIVFICCMRHAFPRIYANKDAIHRILQSYTRAKLK